MGDFVPRRRAGKGRSFFFVLSFLGTIFQEVLSRRGTFSHPGYSTISVDTETETNTEALSFRGYFPKRPLPLMSS